MAAKGILGRLRVALSDGDGNDVKAGGTALPVGGNVASDAVDSGNPVKIGGVGLTALPTAVATGDRVNQMMDVFGRNVSVLSAPRDLITDATTTITSSTSETTILSAVASTFLDLHTLMVCNTSATAVRVDFRSATAGSVRFSLYVPAGATVGFDKAVPINQAAVNNNWTAQCSASVDGVRIFAQAVKNK